MYFIHMEYINSNFYGIKGELYIHTINKIYKNQIYMNGSYFICTSMAKQLFREESIIDETKKYISEIKKKLIHDFIFIKSFKSLNNTHYIGKLKNTKIDNDMEEFYYYVYSEYDDRFDIFDDTNLFINWIGSRMTFHKFADRCNCDLCLPSEKNAEFINSDVNANEYNNDIIKKLMAMF